MSIEDTLRLLDAWFREPTQGPERPKLLSKLAVLELCGWLEGEFDRMFRDAGSASLSDADWAEEIIKRTFGFHYGDHFRPMLARLLGEYLVREVEAELEKTDPGVLDGIRSALGELWKQRCSFAHADMGANLARQMSFPAPSWVSNQHRVLSKRLQRLEVAITTTIARL